LIIHCDIRRKEDTAMDEIRRAIIAHLELLTREQLILLYRLIRMLARK